MSQFTEQATILIKQFESCSTTAYLCPAGYPTIGYGHLLSKEIYEDYRKGNKIASMKQIDEWLMFDMVHASKAVSRLITAPLNQNQFDALTSFTFNLGTGALERSVLKQKLNRLEYDQVPIELMKWVYSGTILLKGLIRRRSAEARLFTECHTVQVHSHMRLIPDQ